MKDFFDQQQDRKRPWSDNVMFYQYFILNGVTMETNKVTFCLNFIIMSHTILVKILNKRRTLMYISFFRETIKIVFFQSRCFYGHWNNTLREEIGGKKIWWKVNLADHKEYEIWQGFDLVGDENFCFQTKFFFLHLATALVLTITGVTHT